MNARLSTLSTLTVGIATLGLVATQDASASVFTGNPFTVEVESSVGPLPPGFVLLDDCESPDDIDVPIEVYSPGDKGEATLGENVCGAELHLELGGSWWSDPLAMPAPGQAATPWTHHSSGLRWRVVR